MENIISNKDDKTNLFPLILSINDENSLNPEQNSYSLTINNKLYSNDNFSLFIKVLF